MEKKKHGGPKFGSVEWQNEQLRIIGRKLAGGKPLSDTDKAFLSVQTEHVKRRKVEPWLK